MKPTGSDIEEPRDRRTTIQIEKLRDPDSLFNDERWEDQWYRKNEGTGS